MSADQIDSGGTDPDSTDPDSNDPDSTDAGSTDAGSTDAGSTDTGDSARFGAAMEELQRLVAELESDRLDVDHLTQRVERATELVMWCRERLDATRFQVEELLVRLDELDDLDEGGADPDEGTALSE